MIKTKGNMSILNLAIVLAILSIISKPLFASGQDVKPELFKQLKYRHIGPVGNRVIAVVGVPAEANICHRKILRIHLYSMV